MFISYGDFDRPSGGLFLYKYRVSNPFRETYGTIIYKLHDGGLLGNSIHIESEGFTVQDSS